MQTHTVTQLKNNKIKLEVDYADFRRVKPTTGKGGKAF